jgi:hypothetical protein
MSTIRFSCSGCGKKIEVPSTAAGKKAKCNECGEGITIPEPTGRPRTTDRPHIPAKQTSSDEGHVKNPVATTRTRRTNTNGLTSISPFKVGNRIDVLEVAECSPNKFVLFDPATSTLLLVLTGAISLAVGILAIGGIQNFFAGVGARGVLTGKAIFGSLAALAYGVVALSWLSRLGWRITIDGSARSFTLSRLYFWHKRWSVGELGGVVFVVCKPNSEKASGDELQQSAEVLLIDQNDQFVASIGDTSIKLNDIVPLARVAVHAARLLRLPLWLDVQGKPMSSSLEDAIHLIQSCDVASPRDLSTHVTRPWISIENVAITAATVVVIAAMTSVLTTKLANPGKTVSIDEALTGAAGRPNMQAGGMAGRGRVEDDPDLAELDKNLAQLQSIDREKRLSGAWDIMGRKVGPRRDEVRKAVGMLLDDPDGEAQKRALRVLGRWGIAEDIPLIAKFTRDRDQTVRADALNALGELKQIDGIPAIIDRFRDKEDRSIAAAALKTFGKSAAMDVATLLNDPDEDIGLEAARVLEQIGTQESIPMLRKAAERYKNYEGFPTPDEFNNPTARRAREMANTLKNALNNARNR